MSDESMLKIYFYRSKNWAIENENLLVLGAGLILIATISFGLGALWQGSGAIKAPIAVNKNQEAIRRGGTNQELQQKQNQELVRGSTLGIQKVEPQNIVAGILYIASKNGTSYHLPTCPGAKQIKSENKIEFKTKEEAEKAGYKPAANCPRLLR